MLDVEQIKRVFVNLIDNALAALRYNGAERLIAITTSRDVDSGVVRAEVADTGRESRRQISALVRAVLFTTRQRHWLGLAIVQRIILEHGGTIRAEKNTPRGAKFVIELPLNHG
jgi:signal transduction histidine kinase